MRTLEEVLKELEAAEKEYKEKCIQYGIEITSKRKKKSDEEEIQEESINDSPTEE